MQRKKWRDPPPVNVRQAMLDKDHDTLSALGKKGGKATAARHRKRKLQLEINKILQKMRKERLERQRLKEARELAEQANEHICPVDED